ncbi:MAG: exodeoxyribonuclease VII large subunit, partial [Candidatus Dormibacteria bacterium]
AQRLAAGRIDLDQRQQRLGQAARRLLAVAGQAVLARGGLLQARGPGRRLLRAREEFGGRVGRLEALSPLAVLSRGYSITLDQEGRVLRAVEDLTEGELVGTRLRRGQFRSRVIEVVAPEEGADGT